MILVLRRLWIQATSDRKRFGLLCGLVVFGLLLWARIIVSESVPRTAVAGSDPILSPGAGASGPATGAGSDKRKIPPVRVELARLPERDPLQISAAHFPRPTSVEALPQEGAKSPREATENVDLEESRLTSRLGALVAHFRLEAVMQGHQMAVIISTKTYRLHDWVPAIDDDQIRFRLVDVRDRSAVLECAGRRFELKMRVPGSQER